MGRPHATCRRHPYIHFHAAVLFNSTQPFHAASLPVTIPLLSLYQRPYSHTFTLPDCKIKHVLYKFVHLVYSRLAKDLNVVFILDAASAYGLRPAPRDAGFGLVLCCQRKFYYHSLVLTTLAFNANAC